MKGKEPKPMKERETQTPQTPQTPESVNHPSHYAGKGIEAIDAIAAATASLSGIEAFDTGNALKYLWRWKRKNGIEDLRKASWYVQHLISYLEGGQESKHPFRG